MNVSRKEQIERIERFRSLWDRLLSLYLTREKFEDVSAAKENDFLALQGTIMQELAALAEFEEGRFALVDEVTSVVNEAISLRHLRDHSDFQLKRRKERGKQVAQLIANFKSFVAERDAAAERKEKELEAKIARPFWDPEKGKFKVLLGRVLVSPSHFFSALRVAGEAQKANSFLLTVLALLSVSFVIGATILNATVVRAISYNFTLETGILTSDASTGAKIVIWLVVVVGVTIVSLAAALVAAILAHLLGVLMHVGFKITGGLGNVYASHKVVAFGLAPLLLLIIPLVVDCAASGGMPSVVSLVLAAVAIVYAAVLHIIGFNKVHGASVAAGIVGWMIGIILFTVFVLGSLWIWHSVTDTLPPSSGKYVYVTAKGVPARRGNQVIRDAFAKGEILEFVEENGEDYVVQREKDDVKIKKSDAELRRGSVLALPGFLVENSLARAEVFIDRLSRKIQK